MTDTINRPHCTQPEVKRPALPPGLAMPRVEAIQLIANKWINGTRLTYFFKTVGGFGWPAGQKKVVRDAFAKWKALGIGLEFAEVAQEADAILLIGLVQGDGSWSYVGTDVLHNRRNGCNMNFGWDLTTNWGKATALHEIGHALGMPHEHQNPQSGIVWNEQRVIEVFSGDPNYWSEDQIRWNILRHLAPAQVQGSVWDPLSIMHYPFSPGLITAPPPFDQDGTPENTELSPNDEDWMRRFYPPIAAAPDLPVDTPVPLSPEVGAQADFIFVPEMSGDYSLQAKGKADLKIAIARSASEGGDPMLAVADDSATPANAAIKQRLEAGRAYRVSARTHFVSGRAAPELVMTLA